MSSCDNILLSIGFQARILQYMLRRRHQRTLDAIFRRPTQSNIRWADIEALFSACGADMEERAGPRIMVELNGIKASFHRPHPGPNPNKAIVESVRDFLTRAGITTGGSYD